MGDHYAATTGQFSPACNPAEFILLTQTAVIRAGGALAWQQGALGSTPMSHKTSKTSKEFKRYTLHIKNLSKRGVSVMVWSGQEQQTYANVLSDCMKSAE